MSILFTGGGGISSEYIYRNLSDEVFFADCNIKRIHPIIPKDRRKKISKAEEENYINDLIKTIKKINCDYLIPTVDEELIKIASYVNYIPCKVILPNTKFVKLFLDKKKSANFFSDRNFGPPAINENELQENIKYILKPKFGRGSRGIFIIDKQYKYHLYLKLFEQNKSDVIIQRLIEGTEYTVTLVANSKGDLINIYPIIAHNKKGSTVEATCSNNKTVIDFCIKFHTLIKINYIYNIQMILDKNNKCHIFEINPRISTTFSIPLKYNNFSLEALLTNSERNLKNWNGIRLSRNYVTYVN